MAIAIQMFQANDGSTFASAAEADAHDFKLENEAKIAGIVENFLNATQKIDRARKMSETVAKDFLAFYLPWLEQGCPEIERTVFDTPKPVVVAEVAAEGVEAPVVAEAVEVADEGDMFAA